MRKKLLPLVIWALGGPWLHAELKWDTQKAELSPKATESFVETTFGFVNAGKAAVEIESVQSSCGCTVPTLAKTSYAPGERGEVLARFTIGDRQGVNTKTIRVAIKGEREPTVLTLVVNIPDRARINPALLVWENGEANEAKTISVQALPDQPLRVLNVVPTNPVFKATVATIQENKEYRITVTPQSTESPGFVFLRIETLLMGENRVLPAYAQIKPRAK